MALLEEHLVVKKSNIPGAGKGLFTKKAIAKGERIVEYKGKTSTWKEVDHRDGSNVYIYYVNRNFVIDARTYPKSLGRYVNDARGLTIIKGLTNNCEYVQEGTRVFIDAIKNIPAGSELFVNYGKEYWDVIRHNIEIDNAAK